MPEKYLALCKILLVSPNSRAKLAGTSTLFHSFLKGEYVPWSMTTAGIDQKVKEHNTAYAGLVRTQIWDTTSHPRYSTMIAPYYRGSHAIIVCINSNDRADFDNIYP